MTTRSGYSQTFTYAADSSLASMSDSFGRTATFEWNKFNVTTRNPASAGALPVTVAVSRILLPGGTSFEYDYEDIPPPDAQLAYGGPKWQSKGNGGTAASGAQAFISFMPKVERLAGVERRAAGGAVLDSVRYLHEDRIYGKNITGIIDHRGERVATFAYDSAARVTKSELAGGAEVNTFAYGMAGAARVRSVTNELGQKHDYTFGELSSTRREYQLNSVAGLATATTPASSTTLAYSGDSFLASATDAEGRVVTSGHQYEPFGPVKAMALGNGLAVANDWGTDGFLAARRLTPAGGGAALSDLAYGRDEAGRIAAITDQVNPTGSAIYGYDPVGRLTMAVTASGAALAESYAYTPGTNRLASVTDGGGVRAIAVRRGGGGAYALSQGGQGSRFDRSRAIDRRRQGRSQRDRPRQSAAALAGDCPRSARGRPPSAPARQRL